MTEYDWLQNLKPGDKVICRSTGIGANDHIRTVDRVTPTQIIIGTDKYRKVNGRRQGNSGWYSYWLKEATPELVAEIEQQARHYGLSRKLQDVSWKKLPLPVLEAVAKVIDEHEAAERKQ